MTITELDALPAGTVLHLPTFGDVTTWVLDRRVGVTNWYTVTHPPDADGVQSNRRPVYLHATDFLHATQDEAQAWQIVHSGLQERIEWIERNRLKLLTV